MKYLTVSGWDKWQTFRKDRGTPPWVKLYRNLLTNPEWAMLSDAEKGQLVSIWIVAADKNGKVTADLRLLRKFCQLDEIPDIKKFQALGFIDATVTTKCQPDGVTVTHQSRVEESRVEESRKNSVRYEAKDVIEYLNTMAGKNYRFTDGNTEQIIARLNEGYTKEDCFTAINNQVNAWIGSDMEQYLRPSTLFQKKKFDGYINNTNQKNKSLSNLSSSEQARVVLENWGSHVDSERSEDRDAEIELIEIKECSNG